jgi:PAS domain S-box-containing protein
MNLSGALARTLLDLAPDATVVVDADGTIVFANAQIERTFGYTPNELTGQPVEHLLPSRFRSGHGEHRAQFAARPKPRAMGEGLTLFGQHKSGREFPVEISLSPGSSDHGLLVVASVRDSTVRQAAERELVEANRAKSRLLAAASHDLRQPVQTLNLLNQTALRLAGTSPALHNILGQQQSALETMAALLASVLDVSKLDSGTVKPAVVDCAINDVFDRLNSDFGPLAEERGIELIVEPTDEGGRTDPELFRRMLGNLLSNSIRYTPRGTVRLQCERVAEDLAVTVRDTGLGIPPTDLDKIFEEFYQVDRGPQRPEGLGLGLSIVRRLASLLGHKVSMQSAVGEGTAFTIKLPRVALAAVARRPSAAHAASAPGKILVIDDEPAVAHATSLLLELEGFDVHVANCKSEALEHSQAVRPDLIISDYHLRGPETGAEVLVELRTRLGTAVPAIFVTGDTGKVAFSLASLANTSLLSKPTRADELLDTIRKHLANNASDTGHV